MSEYNYDVIVEQSLLHISSIEDPETQKEAYKKHSGKLD